jgi:hypothetical protein
MNAEGLCAAEMCGAALMINHGHLAILAMRLTG